MREFIYLVGGKGDEGSPGRGRGRGRGGKAGGRKAAARTAANTVLLAMTRAELKTRPVLWNQKNFHYYVFDSVAELASWYETAASQDSEGQRHYYEVIFGDERQRLKFDLDHITTPEMLDSVMRAIREVAQEIGLSGAAMLLFRTSEAGFHIVIDHFVANVAEAKDFAERVRAKMSSPELVDPKVYATTQNFRLVGSSKVAERGASAGWAKTLVNAQKIDLRQTLIREYSL